MYKHNTISATISSNKDGVIFMDKTLTSYIDNNLIREYAYQTRDGYSLQICDIEKHDQENLISWLFEHDEVTKDLILDRAQDLINSRLPFVEARDKYNDGLFPRHDSQTGEVTWSKAGGL